MTLQKHRFAWLMPPLLSLLCACAGTNSDPEILPEAQALEPGTTLHYVRSNQDLTNPRDIYVHLVSPTELAVVKRQAPCTDAALVTASFDPETGEALTMTGGRLDRNGEQVAQAFLTFDPDTRMIEIRFGSPDGTEPQLAEPAPPAPWRMYDFDLAEFALFGPAGMQGTEDFTFGLALAWPADDAPPFQILGDYNAELSNSQLGDDGLAKWNMFKVTGDGIEEGDLWLDARSGHVVQAYFQRPNHPGYDDFSLRLVETMEGAPAWTTLLQSHWTTCPEESD